MKLKISTSFRDKLNHQIEFIAKDKPLAARKFKSELISKIKQITHMPYMHRKSQFFDREDIRDLIYKGYVVVYKVNEKNDIIEVFGLIKYEDAPFL